MAPDDHASQVSLPSIHEMFPGWKLPGPSEQRWSRFAGDQRHSCTVTNEPVLSENNTPSSPPMNHKDHGQRSTVTSNPLGSNNSTYRRGFPATTPMSSHDHRSTYSFDVLKPHPLTANLMNAMTSPNTTSLSGSATVGGGLSSARGDSHVEFYRFNLLSEGETHVPGSPSSITSE
ncbi:hypothetical protein NLI96_g2739 [Meripilus lineatus]|uniref:Uncharacterized protein n=1 Tax=Meripilus lineatus TaxID=2056292 RepID=A0AAD5V7S1_9APHY|nr:hypothetical protein NLI96_g2739 [Physisporinus lineatus]